MECMIEGRKKTLQFELRIIKLSLTIQSKAKIFLNMRLYCIRHNLRLANCSLCSSILSLCLSSLELLFSVGHSTPECSQQIMSSIVVRIVLRDYYPTFVP